MEPKRARRTDIEIEKLVIEEVKKRPLLYDLEIPGNRDLRERHALWKEIAEELKIDAHTVKQTWEGLRRRFQNAKNRRQSKYPNREYPLVESSRLGMKWIHQDRMSFLIPSTEESKAENGEVNELLTIDIKTEPEEHSTFEAEVVQLTEPKQSPVDPLALPELQERPPTIKRPSCKPPFKVPKWTMNISQEYHLDDNDLFFLSMARESRKLTSFERAKIKAQLSHEVLQAVIVQEELMGPLATSNPFKSSNFNPFTSSNY